MSTDIYRVYVITNLPTGKKYVGCSRNGRLRLYGHWSVKADWLEGGFQYLEVACAKTRHAAGEAEATIIGQENCLMPNGFNRSTGGFRAYRQHVLTRELITEKAIGRPSSRKGAVCTPEKLAQMSATTKEWLKSNPHPMLGKRHTDETKKKISAANSGVSRNKGRVVSEETKAAMSAAHAKRKAAGLKRAPRWQDPESQERFRLNREARKERNKERMRERRAAAKLQKSPSLP